MGMYARINAQLQEAYHRRDELDYFLHVESDITADDEVMLELMDVEQEIGELKAALVEMAEVDGYGVDSYGEWMDTFAEDFDGYYDPSIDDSGEGGYVCE